MKKRYIILGVLILLIGGAVFGIIYIKHGKGIIKPKDTNQITFLELTESNSDDSLLGFSFVFACDPDFSPDANKIVFEKIESNEQGLYIINSDGTGKIQLTTDEDGYCSSPSFSSNGSKIVYLKGFVSYMPGGEKTKK